MKKINVLFFLSCILILLSSCSTRDGVKYNLGRWKLEKREVYLPSKLEEGEKCYYESIVRGGIFKNFRFTAKLKLSDRGLAKFWFHTDKKLSKGYRIFINDNNETEKRRTGSIEGIRSRYKNPVPSGNVFKLEVEVDGKVITIKVNDEVFVEYTQPDSVYRLPENRTMILDEKGGLFAFEVLEGKLSILEAEVITLEDDVSPYKDGRVIKIEDERNNKIIELEQKGVPVIDLHIPAKQADGGSAKGTMAFRSLNHGLIYTPEIIVPLLISEENKIEFIKRNKKEPLFFNGISLTDNRSVERSKIMEILPLFEYVVGDAMTIVDHRGRFTRLWIDEDVKVDISVQDYMDRIVNNIVKMLNEKNIDVYVNATYLPDKLMPYYDELWTDKRIEKVVDALVANHIALEINGKKKIPNLKFLQAAKEDGVKFTLGGQDFDNPLRGLDYALDMVLKLNLEAENMYIPK